MGSVICSCHIPDEESENMTSAAVRTRADDEEYAAPVAAAIKRLQELKINFLAVDFDCTLIDIHTGGRWQGSHDEILQHVRPYFPPFLDAALSNNIHVAVVTFSPQVELVRSVLEHYLGRKSSRIPIRAGGQFSYQGQGVRDGKQAHMASAVEELELTENVHITKNTSLLIDDDVKNVRTALRDGVRAVWLNTSPNQAETLLQDISRLL